MGTIKVKPWGKDQGDYVLIEDEDFNPEVHEEFEAGEKISDEDKKFNALIPKIDTLNEKGLKFCAKYLGLEFTTKEETVAKIKEVLAQN